MTVLIGCRLCRRILYHFSTQPSNHKGMACKEAGWSSWTRNKAYSKSCIINTIERGAWPRDRAGRRLGLHVGLLGCWWLWDFEVFVHLAYLCNFVRVFAIVFIQDICWHLIFANKIVVKLQAIINIIFAHIWQPQPVVTYFIFSTHWMHFFVQWSFNRSLVWVYSLHSVQNQFWKIPLGAYWLSVL